MKKIYQEPLLEVVKLQTMQMLAVSVKDGDVTDINDLLAPEIQQDIEYGIILWNDDVIEP